MSSKTAGVVLCGGLSRRMGRDKSQMRWGDSSWLDCAKSLLKNAGLGDVYVSGNQHPEGIKDIIADAGPLSGLFSVTDTLIRATYSGAVFIPIDMPAFEPANLSELVSAGTQGKEPVFFEGFHLPLYLPITEFVRDALYGLIQTPNRSIGHALDVLNAKALSPVNSRGFENFNTEQAWRAFVTEHPANTR